MGAAGGRGRLATREAELSSGSCEEASLWSWPWPNSREASGPGLLAQLPERSPFSISGRHQVLSGVASKDALRTAGSRVSGAAVGPGAGAELRGAASISPLRARCPPPHLMCREKPDTMILTRKLDLCLAVRPAARASCGGDPPRRKCHPALSSRCLTFCDFAALSEESRNRVARVSWSGGGGVWGKQGS